jgi:hypothetical protein
MCVVCCVGSQLGLHITALGVQKFPLGSATIITAPAADGYVLERYLTICKRGRQININLRTHKAI